MNLYLLSVPGVVLLAMAVWTWALHIRQQRRIDALEGRVANLLAGLALLTDTAETGLRDVTAEVSRLTAGEAGTRALLSTRRRIARAARRGQSIQAIAAAEQMSEGEVKLRLSLTPTQEATHATLR